MTRPRTVDKLLLLQRAVFEGTRAQARVFVFLQEHENSNYGYAWPAVETVAAETGLSDRSVQMSIRWLAENGFIEITEGGGRTLSNRYRVLHGRIQRSVIGD